MEERETVGFVISQVTELLSSGTPPVEKGANRGRQELKVMITKVKGKP